MTMKKTKAWLLSAAMAAGVASFAPSSSWAKDNNKDREEWVKYEDVPKTIKAALDRERGKHEIKRIDHVFRDGREFYRAILDTKGEDTVIRLSEGGKLLSREEVADVAVGKERNSRTTDREGVRRDLNDGQTQVKYASLTDRVKETLDRERGSREVKSIYRVTYNGQVYYSALIDERNGDRRVNIGENGKVLSEEDVREARPAVSRIGDRRSDDTRSIRRGVEDDGDRIAFDRLPGEVKTVLGREAGPDRVGDVFRYDRRGQTVYEAEITSGSGTRIVRVNENGRVVSETDATPEGRRSVRLNDLPGAVKDTIGREVPRDQMGRIVEINQNGRTYYRAQIDRGRDRESSWVTVDENGRVVRDFDRDRDRR